MRKNIVHQGAKELNYEIRGIVKIAEDFEKLGIPITWENIGDPVAKGEQVPSWIKEIVKKSLNENDSWGYCPTKGIKKARENLLKCQNAF